MKPRRRRAEKRSAFRHLGTAEVDPRIKSGDRNARSALFRPTWFYLFLPHDRSFALSCKEATANGFSALTPERCGRRPLRQSIPAG
jgi:hypothetical protein